MDAKTLLDEEIKRVHTQMSKLYPDSKEYAEVEDNWVKLMDRKLEIEKLELSKAQAEQQVKEERKSRLIKNAIDIGGIILPLSVTVWGAIVSFKFEETGTITSNMGRKFMDKIIKR